MKCPGGEIGRRATLRSLWRQLLAGSNPVLGTFNWECYIFKCYSANDLGRVLRCPPLSFSRPCRLHFKSVKLRSRLFILRFYPSKYCFSNVRFGLPGAVAPVANIVTRLKRRLSFAIFPRVNKAKPANVETRAKIEPLPSSD